MGPEVSDRIIPAFRFFSDCVVRRKLGPRGVAPTPSHQEMHQSISRNCQKSLTGPLFFGKGVMGAEDPHREHGGAERLVYLRMPLISNGSHRGWHRTFSCRLVLVYLLFRSFPSPVFLFIKTLFLWSRGLPSTRGPAGSGQFFHSSSADEFPVHSIRSAPIASMTRSLNLW